MAPLATSPLNGDPDRQFAITWRQWRPPLAPLVMGCTNGAIGWYRHWNAINTIRCYLLAPMA
jgi:hypothetical protein